MITKRTLFWWVKSSNLKLQILLLLIILITVGARVAPLEMQKRIVNEAIRLHNVDLLLLYCATYIIAVLIASGLKFLINIMQTRLGQQALAQMRKQLYAHILTLPLGFFQKSSPGMVVSSLVTELAAAGEFVGQAVAVPIGNLLMLLGLIGYMFYLDPLLAILSVSTYPLAVFLVPLLQRKSNAANKERVDSTRRMSSLIDEVVSGIQEIHGNGSYRMEERRFGRMVDELFKIRVVWITYKGAAKVLNNLIQNLGPFTLFLVGGWLAINGRFDLGALVAFLSAYEKLYDPWKEMMEFYQVYQDASVGYARIMEYFDTKPEYEIEPSGREPISLEGAITASRVSMSVDGGIQLLRGIDLSLAPGERLALVGYSGSGKSTLAKCICQLYSYSSGSIQLDGNEVSKLTKADIASNMGIVSQSPFIFEGTIKENVVYSCEAVRGQNDRGCDPSELPQCEEIFQILKEVGLFQDVLSFGLNTMLQVHEEEEFVEKLIRVRHKFQEHFGSELSGYFEFFDEQKFLKYSSIAANIVFGSPNQPEFSMNRLSSNPYFLSFLDEAQLKNPLIELGRDLSVTAIDILGKMPPDEIFFKQTPLVAGKFDTYRTIAERIHGLRLHRIDKEDQLMLLDLALRYIPGRHKIIGMPSMLEGLVMSARELFKERITQEHPRAISFYDMSEYIHSLPILDNILFGKATTHHQRAQERISRSSMQFLEEEDLLSRIVEIGLHFNVGSKGERLSGGQRQKLAIARVLLKRPRILILDEATSALDNTSQNRIQELLDTQWKGKSTIISVAHRLDTIKDYDRIAVMRAGKIVETGTFDELMACKGMLHGLIHGTRPDLQ
ncbi:MAG: ABC transporter ATP-binding protein/permease [Syntrophobacteraceae bacterium]